MTLAPDPIIIYGAPRSGTTYLNELLNAHPDVYISHETRLFAWMHESLVVSTQNDRLLVSYRDQFVEHLTRCLPDLIRQFHAKQWPIAQYWGDKNPHYADEANRGCLETIRRLFPGAKFIHIVRDGRDVVSSLIRKQHADGRPWVDLPTACDVWCQHIDNGSAFGRAIDPGSYFEIRYEDLVENDIRHAEAIFQFLRIPIHDHVLEFCRQQSHQRTEFSGPTRNLGEGVARSNWDTVLTIEQRQQYLQRLLPGLIKFRYANPESC
ncbi:hypothetical protein BH11PLA2_BH11PLA2_17620 [soil metagenome]